MNYLLSAEMYNILDSYSNSVKLLRRHDSNQSTSIIRQLFIHKCTDMSELTRQGDLLLKWMKRKHVIDTVNL